MGWANPIREHVDGAPYQRGTPVRVVGAIDRHVHDVSPLIGACGIVDYLEYECGCGQQYPHDPMLGVVFPDGHTEEFWAEELAATSPEVRAAPAAGQGDPVERQVLGLGMHARGRPMLHAGLHCSDTAALFSPTEHHVKVAASPCARIRSVYTHTRERHGAAEEDEEMSETIYETACRVVDAAGQAGGIDEVRRIAERGWPCEVDGQPASPELLVAIQDRAREIAAEVQS